MAVATLSASGSAAGRRRWAVIGLTGPAYVWLAFTVLLPLSAMLYFSFLTVAPFGNRVAEPTLGNYIDYFRKGFYLTLTGRSLWLGVWVTALCLLLGFPAALALAKYVKGRWREAHFLLDHGAAPRRHAGQYATSRHPRAAPSRHHVHLHRRGHRPGAQLPALH